jgi:tetratricopeptide (TPR) repeat protein
VVEAQENHFAEAESNFQRAIQIAPRFTGAYLNLGRLYQEHPNEPRAVEKALSVYRQLLDFEPDHVEANYQAAWLLSRAGEYAASLRYLARLPAPAQQRAPALALRCAGSAALGRLADANAAAKQLLSSSELDEADVLPIVPVLAEHHAEDLATQLLETLLRRRPASSGVLRGLAALQEKQSRFREARAALEKDLELEQPSAALLSQLARLAYRAGDLEGALGYLAHARDLEPGNAAIHFFFGMVCVDLKLPPEAKKSLQEAVRLDPDNPSYNYALGAVLVSEKNAEAAIAHFRTYRQKLPNDPRGRFALGVAYFDAYQPDSARREFLAIADRPETRLGAHLYLGRLAMREDHLDEALRHFQLAIQANPSDPEAYAESALAHIRLKDYAAAEIELARALEDSPDHYRSNLNLLMLYQRTKDPRAEEQSRRVADLQKRAADREQSLLRSLEIRPY